MRATQGTKWFCSMVISSLIMGIALVLTGCTQGGQGTPPPTSNSQTFVDVSWAKGYHDLKSLKQDSDIAVVGVITGIASVTQDNAGVPDTDFTFAVRQVFWNPQKRPVGFTILLHQTGGVINGQRIEASDDPLFQQGEQAVLFLHEYSPGHYFVIGGPSGRFLIQGGLVKPISDEGVHFAAPLPLATFIANVQNA
jgi:hypothetical protein